MNVGFFHTHLSERGTNVAAFDYARYNIDVLGNKSYIYYIKNNPITNDGMVKRYLNEFENVYPVDNFRPQCEELFLEHDIDVVYLFKAGYVDEDNIIDYFSKVCKTVVHCVFSARNPHGDIYSALSKYIPGGDNVPVVPYMVSLPEVNEDMRDVLGIPKNAIVFGGYGGRGCFSIDWVKDVIKDICKEDNNIYFLFANFDKFIESDRVIFLDCITDLYEKVKFINTTDAMLHARIDGETFGLAIAEFSSKNKPVFTSRSGSLAHIELLGEKCVLYHNNDDLKTKIINFDKDYYSNMDWNAYRNYSPEKVMSIFKDVYLND